MLRWDAVRRQKSARRPDHRRLRLLFEPLEDRRMLAVDWRNPVDALDVDADHVIAPLDALLVINDLNANNPRLLPLPRDPVAAYLDVDGDQNTAPIDALVVINAINAGIVGPRVLTEGSKLAIEVGVTITLGQAAGGREYRFQIDSAFDTSATGAALEDLLAVYLVDPENLSQTLLDRGVAGTSLFTLAGTRAEFVPGLVRWDGSVVTIDTTSLSPRDTGVLQFQLLNSDADAGSRVTIRPLSNDVDPLGTVNPMFAITGPPFAAGAEANLAGLTASPNVKVLVENVRFDSVVGRYTAELRLDNDGVALGRNSVVAFPDLPDGVTLLNPSGTTATGAPYVNFRPAIARGGLVSGAMSDRVLVELDDPDQIPFSLRPEILSGPNHAPVLDPIGTRTMFPGGVLKVPLLATDQDGDAITFSLAGSPLPTGTLRADGTLVFRPTPAQLGSYEFDVLASDGALEVSQQAMLNVVADPITTTRVSGQVLQVDGQPIAGMQVEIGGVSGLTMSDGSFILDLGSGPIVSDTLKIRGDLFPGPLDYPFIAEKLAFVLEHPVFTNVNNVIDRPIYLPALDLENGMTIDPAVDTNVTTAAIPGASVFVQAGTLMNQQGTPFTGVLSITEVPVNLTPAVLPPNLVPDLVVTVQPGEMVFAAPAPMSFPNRSGWAPGTQMDLWSINPVTGQFEDVGDMEVSADGSTIDTISGGVRNSSWHFPAPPPPEPEPPEEDPRNPDTGCNQCPAETGFASRVELHSGAVLETHDLVRYQSLGTARGVSLTYDSLRADPRPILHFGYSSAIGDSEERLMARLSVRGANDFTYAAPGANTVDGSLPPGAHFWTLPTSASSVDVALQADLRTASSGVYTYSLDSGIVRLSDGRVVGSTSKQEGPLLHVNTIGSSFGSGWGLAGLQELVENPDGSVLLIDGDGSEILFRASGAPATPYGSPPGDFSALTKAADGSFQRVMKDQTVYSFAADHKLVSTRDRNGNQTNYQYSGGRLTKIIDPVGLETNFTYTGGRVTSITDPAGRTTALTYDAAGNLSRITDPDNSARNWTYDGEHHMVSETDQLGFREQSFYDAAGRATRAIRKDGSEIVVQPVQVQGLSDPALTSDPINAPPATDLGAAVARSSDGNGNVRETRVDRAGQLVDENDGGGPRSSSTRNSSNLVTSEVDGKGHERRFAYDAAGNLLETEETLSPYEFQRVYRVSTGGVNELDAPTWIAPSPDGRFVYVTGDASDTVVVFRRDESTGLLTRVETVRDLVGGVEGLDGARGAVVSPDGANLYVASRDGSTLAVFQRDPITGKLTFLEKFADNSGGVDGLAGARCVAISPDGKNVYVASLTDAAVAVFARDAATGRLTFVEVQSNGVAGVSGLGNSHDVSLSPDGASVYATGTTDNSLVVFQRDPVTGRLTFVERHQEGVNGETGLSGAYTSKTSPDGQFVYLASYLSDAVTVFTRNLATGQLTWLRTFKNGVDGISGLDGAFCIAISADGTWLYVVNFYNNTLVAFRRDLASGDLNQVMTWTDGQDGVDGLSGAHAVATSPNGTSIYAVGFTDDSIAVFRPEEALLVHYTYESQFSQLQSITDELGHQTLFDIDPANGNRLSSNRVVGATGGTDDVVTDFTYTAQGQVDTETDPLGHVTDYDYNARGWLTQIIHAVGTPDQASEQFEYDLNTVAGRAGLITAHVDANGHRSIFDYDALNRRVKMIEPDPDGAGPLTSLVTTWEYDARSNVVKATDPLSHVATMEYDALDRMVKNIDPDPDGGGPLAAPITRHRYDLAGNRVAEIDPNGFETKHVYDARNRLVATTDPDGGVTKYGYDANHNRTLVVDPIGNRTTFTYDARNRLTNESVGGALYANDFESTVGSEWSNSKLSTTPIGSRGFLGDFANDTVSLQLDSLPLHQEVTIAFDLFILRSWNGNGPSFGPDVWDLSLRDGPTLLHTTFANSNSPLTNQQAYPGTYPTDANPRLTGASEAHTLGYLHFGSVADSVYHLSFTFPHVVDSLTFDFSASELEGLSNESWGLDNVVVTTGTGTATATAAATKRFEYDGVNNRTAITDSNGRRTEFRYDELDRLTNERWVGGGNEFVYTYDPVGNRLSSVDQFSTLTMTYDARDRIRSVDNLNTPGAPHVELNYSYDAVGNVLAVAETITAAAGATTAYAYDGLDRLMRLTQAGANAAAKRVDLVFNSLGQFASIDRFADLAASQPVVGTSYTYDGMNRLSRLAHSNSSNTVAFYDFAYDAANRITRIADVDGATDYAYDDRDQLTAANHSAANNPDESYSYDANGNRVTSHQHGNGYATGPQSRLLSDGTFNYSYDAEGNLIRRTEIASGKTREFQWDFRNRLTAVVDRDAASVETHRETFSYDALDRRISKTEQTAVGTAIMYFIYDRDNVLLDFVDNDGTAGPNVATLDRRYLHAADVDHVLAQDDGAGGVQWHLADQIGTIRDLVDNSGHLQNHITYDGFGNVVSQSNAAIESRYLFTGREFDAETGLFYYRARYYDANVGRFVSEDPIGFFGGDSNFYRYTGNDPIDRRDPSGLIWLAPIEVVSTLLRKEPSHLALGLAQLNYGDQVLILFTARPGWYYVRTNFGLEGYVNAGAIAPQQFVPRPPRCQPYGPDNPEPTDLPPIVFDPDAPIPITGKG